MDVARFGDWITPVAIAPQSAKLPTTSLLISTERRTACRAAAPHNADV
jgi:hypothetical protein